MNETNWGGAKPMAEVLPYTLRLQARPIYPARSLLNLLCMGHCAPTVMQTVLQLTRGEQEWLVKLTSGLPGGIGNTQGECGGVTSPLIILGLRHGLEDIRAGVPRLQGAQAISALLNGSTAPSSSGRSAPRAPWARRHLL